MMSMGLDHSASARPEWGHGERGGTPPAWQPSAEAPAESSTVETGRALALPTFDDLPDGVVIVDSNGVVQLMNLACAELLQRTAADVVGRPFEELVVDEDIPRPMGFRFLFLTGALHDVHLSFFLPDGGQRQLFVSTALSGDGSRVVLTARPAGLVHRELEDASLWVAQVQRQSTTLAAARDALARKHADLESAHRDIEQAYARLQEETRAREQLQQELGLARRLEAIGQLSAGMAHEINTPLQYVGDSVHFFGRAYGLLERYVSRIDELTLEGAPRDWDDFRGAVARTGREARLPFVVEELPRAVLAAKDGIEHVSRIVRALKVFSHQGSAGKMPADLNAAIENTLLVAQNEYRDVATVTTRLAELPLVVCNISQLNQVFLQLIINAAHAIADAGRERRGEITITSLAGDQFVEVSVRDDGCGIPEAARDRIFEQFFTTKQVGRGTGQGLALAHQIVVKGHGGTLTFATEVGRGTVFTLRLPLAA
jgi:signal transduction histidine kinase